MRAPTEDRGLLFDPGPSAFTALVDENRRRLAAARFEVAGTPDADLRAGLRSRFFQDDADLPLVLTGHQPGFFHPGVWAKDFMTAWGARAVGGQAGHVVIDSDLASAGVAVPVRNGERLDVDRVTFDIAAFGPWEDRAVLDADTLGRFPDEVVRKIGLFEITPLAADKAVRDAVESVTRTATPRLDEATTGVRVAVEKSWGVDVPQVRLSELESTPTFDRLLAHCVVNRQRFATDYNAALRDHRQAHGLKRPGRPVPDLRAEEPTLELPFWVWRAGSPFRKRLEVTEAPGGVFLSSDGITLHEKPIDDEPDALCAALAELRAGGLRVRSRALMTTLFLRLFVADAFVHGIGGALYDEVTDRLIGRHFGVDPPRFATVSATLRLPLADDCKTDPAKIAAERQRLRRGLRDLTYRPERFLGDTDSAAVEKKTLLIERQHEADGRSGLTRANRRRLHAANEARREAFLAANDEIAAEVAGLEDFRRDFTAGLARLDTIERTHAIATDREYAFPLFPEAKIRPFMEELAEHGTVNP
ncbi:MAG: hypothetical protein AAGJ97_00860 [Planctomycetota bacterium]